MLQFHPTWPALGVISASSIQFGATILGVINGLHLLLSSAQPEQDRAFFRDILKFPFVDAGEGWLIFALPPSEMGIHPADASLTAPHAGQNLAAGTLYLVCDDLQATLDRLASQGVTHGEIADAGWGKVSSIALPGGSRLGLYEPYHRMATSISAVRRKRSSASDE